MSPLQPQQCFKGFHEIAEASDGPPQVERDAESRQDLEQQLQKVLALLRLLGDQLGKVTTVPNTGDLIPGTPNQHDPHGPDPTRGKGAKITRKCQSALCTDRVSVRKLSRLTGMMSATTLAVLLAPLYYRGLQELKIQALTTSQSFKTMVRLNKKVRMELGWWITMLEKWKGRPILPFTPDLTTCNGAYNGG